MRQIAATDFRQKARLHRHACCQAAKCRQGLKGRGSALFARWTFCQLALQNFDDAFSAHVRFAEILPSCSASTLLMCSIQRATPTSATTRGIDIALGLLECSHDFVGTGRLGQVMRCAELDCLDRGGDAGVTGQHHNARGAVQFVQALTTASPESLPRQIDHGEFGRFHCGLSQRFASDAACLHAEAAPLQHSGEHRAEGFVVVHQQQTGA